ncbi:MAG: C4-type zinc ribbon domain-containing protein [Clostridiales bacterium]|nr:C4-type zinc ribbon domain-containing protein [Clostridiales bacterium]
MGTDRNQILLALSDNNAERNRVDPRRQLAALYREIKDFRNTIAATERKLEILDREYQERQDELDELILNGPRWEEEIASSKDKMVRQRGLTLKDMLEIQQDVVRLEESLYFGEARANDLRGLLIQYEKNREKLISRSRELKANYNQHAEVYNQEKAKTDVLMAEFASTENQLLEGLKPEERAIYREALRSNPENPVVKLEGEICGGCRIVLSRQLLKQVNQGAQLIFCENCLRIILPPE